MHWAILFDVLLKFYPCLSTKLFLLKHFWDFNPCLSTRLFYSNVFNIFSLKSNFPNKIRVFLSLPYFQFLKMTKRGNCRHCILSGLWVLFRVRNLFFNQSKFVQISPNPNPNPSNPKNSGSCIIRGCIFVFIVLLYYSLILYLHYYIIMYLYSIYYCVIILLYY